MLDAPTEVSTAEAIQLGAVDTEFFTRTFFPRLARQKSPEFHREIDTLLDSQARMVNILAFRGSAKTSKCRVFTAKRIAYGLSKTILYIGKSETHAIRSVSWLKHAIEFNNLFAQTFALEPGSKWQDTEAEIVQRSTGDRCWIMAAGITGSIRGVNRNDFRPDLIVLDDVLDDENASTPEQREKIENLIYGAVLESLVPSSEDPTAKMISLNTPQDKQDYAVKALQSPMWASAVFGCWTRETANAPTHLQESIWEERFPTEELRKQKQNAAAINRLSTFLREKELKLVSPEKSVFKLPWLRKYRSHAPMMTCVYTIDPVPPPSEKALATGLKNNDYEAHVVVGAKGRDRFLLDYRISRGHTPTWSSATAFELYRKWRPFRVMSESVAYQRTLKWFMQQEMARERTWFHIEEWTDKRAKFARISSMAGVMSSGRFWVREDMTDFLEQYGTYPQSSNDDILDACATAINFLEGMQFDSDGNIVIDGDAMDNDGAEMRPLRINHAP